MKCFVKPRSKASLNIIQQVHKEFRSDKDEELCDKAFRLIRKFTEDMTKSEAPKKRLNQRLDYFIIKMICHSVTTVRKIDDNRGTKDAQLLSQIGLKITPKQYDAFKTCCPDQLTEGDPVEISLRGNFHTPDRRLCTTIKKTTSD